MSSRSRSARTGRFTSRSTRSGRSTRTSRSGRSTSRSAPWIKRKGKLGGKGYTLRSERTRRQILDRCVAKYGYRSCLGSVMVLERSRAIEEHHKATLRSDRLYLEHRFGGRGSFSPKRSPKRTRRASRRSPKKGRRTNRSRS